ASGGRPADRRPAGPAASGCTALRGRGRGRPAQRVGTSLRVPSLQLLQPVIGTLDRFTLLLQLLLQLLLLFGRTAELGLLELGQLPLELGDSAVVIGDLLAELLFLTLNLGNLHAQPL